MDRLTELRDAWIDGENALMDEARSCEADRKRRLAPLIGKRDAAKAEYAEEYNRLITSEEGFSDPVTGGNESQG